MSKLTKEEKDYIIRTENVMSSYDALDKIERYLIYAVEVCRLND